MVTVVGIRFKKAGKIYYFNPDDIDIKVGDNVIVETARGIEYGEAVVGIKDVEEDKIVPPLKKVLRIANLEDKIQHKNNIEKRKKAFEICSQKILEHKLEMKLIDVEYTFDNNKVIFYFTADGRIDFRELVKDLASIFKTRIELRQIGVRDEAKMIGGIGPCGKTLCCASWLGDFEPVSIKMAKIQNLSLNPTKISGICSRLMCCLKYENSVYEELKTNLPEIGQKVKTNEGVARVIDNSVLFEKVKVRYILNKDSEADEKLSDEIAVYNKNDVEILDLKAEKIVEELEDNELTEELENLLDEEDK